MKRNALCTVKSLTDIEIRLMFEQVQDEDSALDVFRCNTCSGSFVSVVSDRSGLDRKHSLTREWGFYLDSKHCLHSQPMEKLHFKLYDLCEIKKKKSSHLFFFFLTKHR